MNKLTIEPGTGNVYADLGMADAHEMLVYPPSRTRQFVNTHHAPDDSGQSLNGNGAVSVANVTNEAICVR